jgi:putative polyketide hydroxylase
LPFGSAVVSPTRPAWTPQDYHEPILVEHLRGFSSASVRLGCELQEITQDATGIHAVVVADETHITEDITAPYVIAADGARSTLREQLGIEMIGPDDLADHDRVEFSAALWSVVGQHRYGLYATKRPEEAVTVIPLGRGDRWGLAREAQGVAPE